MDKYLINKDIKEDLFTTLEETSYLMEELFVLYVKVYFKYKDTNRELINYLKLLTLPIDKSRGFSGD